MKKFQELLEKYLLPLATKIQGNVYISAVSDGFSQILPVIMMGAIFTLFANMQLGPYQTFVESTGLKQFFGFASGVTTDMLAIYAVIAISYQLTAKKNFQNEAHIVSTIALVMFLLLIPLGVTGTAENSQELVYIKGALSTGYLGAKGLFMAIIVGLLVPTIYLFFPKRGIVLKLPPSVPPTVSKAFTALIPAFAVLIIFSLIRTGFTFTSFGDANTFVYQIAAVPLEKLGSSPLAFIIFIIFSQLLWFFGIHGFLVILPFVQTIYLPLSLENLSAFEMGLPLPHQIVYPHFGTYVLIGGSGALLGIAILMAFTAKSTRYRTLGKLGLPSTIFGINEPIIFGTPMVLNSLMLIPFILCPVLSFVLPYLLQIIGILPTLRGVSLPLGTPVILYGWLEGGLPIVIMQLVLILLQMICYYPFFRLMDKQALQEEQSEAIEMRQGAI